MNYIELVNLVLGAINSGGEILSRENSSKRKDVIDVEGYVVEDVKQLEDKRRR